MNLLASCEPVELLTSTIQKTSEPEMSIKPYSAIIFQLFIFEFAAAQHDCDLKSRIFRQVEELLLNLSDEADRING